MSKFKKKEIKEKLKKIFDYANFTYSQPRDSDCDNSAFLNIGNNIGKIIKEYL